MKKAVVPVIMFLLLVSASYGAVIEANMEYVSRYMWRGYDLNLGQPALQPELKLNLGDTGLSIGLWSSFNIGSLTKKMFDEIDYSLEYASSLNDELSYTVGYTAYTYPRFPEQKTGELIFSFTGEKLCCSPTLMLSYDSELGRGMYASVSVKNSYELLALKLDAMGSVGYDGGQFGAKQGISDGALELSSTFLIGWVPFLPVNVTPKVAYTFVNEESRPSDKSTFWFGLNGSASL